MDVKRRSEMTPDELKLRAVLKAARGSGIIGAIIRFELRQKLRSKVNSCQQ